MEGGCQIEACRASFGKRDQEKRDIQPKVGDVSFCAFGLEMKDDFLSDRSSALHALGRVNFWSVKPIGSFTGKPLSPVSQRALVFSYRNLSREVSLQEAAQYACVTPGHLERKLKDEIGQGFHGWHTGERIALAMMRMKVFEDTPQQAMLTAGFRDCVKFAHLFRARTGMCAQDYRDKALREMTPLGRVKAREGMKKWDRFREAMLLILEGKVTKCRMERAVRLQKEAKLGIYVTVYVAPPETRETNSAEASLGGEVKI